MNFFPEFNYSFKWVDDQKYGKREKETGEWNGMMGELLAQVIMNLEKKEFKLNFKFKVRKKPSFFTES